MLSSRQLNCERELRMIVAVYDEATEAEALSATVLELGPEFLNPDETLVAIFILFENEYLEFGLEYANVPRYTGQELRSRRTCCVRSP